MPSHRLIIALPRKDHSRIIRLFPAGQTPHFLYLGVDFFKRQQLERELGAGFIRMDISALHDRVAREIRSDHIKWIDQLNRRYGQDVEWWFTRTASRNSYFSNLFQYSCYLETLERIWNDSDAKPELIFVESPGLATSIRDWAARRGIAAQVIPANTEKYYLLSNYVNSLIRFGYFICTLLLRKIAAYISKKKFGAKAVPQGKLVIVDTFVHDNSLDDDGVFHDIYLPHLYEYLEKNGFQVLIHPVLFGFSFNFISIYKRMRQSGTYFILPEDYLHFSDYLSLLGYPFRTWRRKIAAEPFRNFDLAGIINEDEAKGLGDSSSLLAGLIYRLFFRLGRTGMRPQRVISWYENQVIDKALMAAARQAFPQTRLVGAQICLYAYNLLFLFPVQSEVEAGIVPHLLLGMSEQMCKFAQTFTQDLPCRPAAALRYAHIFGERRKDMAAKQGSTVLVLLPHDLPEAAELLEILLMGLNRLQEDARVLIKCHPNFTPQELKRAVGEQHWSERFEIYQGVLAEAMRGAAVVISSTSGTIVEAAALGVPVIFVGRQTALNYNVLEDVEPELIMECFTEEELMAAINKCFNLTFQEVEQYKALGERIVKLFFLPITDDTMRPFFDDVNNNTLSQH
jgi:hypothetical protein